MKTPITVLEELQRDLTCSPLVSMQCLLDFAKHDLEAVIQALYDNEATNERRLAARDEEIKELERQLPNDVFFNRLADEYSQLELNAEHEIKEVA